jgi:flagellar motility protein MotE (MotC chaperone)
MATIRFGRLAMLASLVIGLVAQGPQGALAEDASKDPTARSIATDYCEKFSDAVADARAKRQEQALTELRNEIDAKLKEVQARTADLKEMIRKRDEMLDLASNELLKIYSRMDTEPAARQLEKIDINTAASILRRLKPQLAGQILATMDVKRASLLVQIIANQNSNIEQEKRS